MSTAPTTCYEFNPFQLDVAERLLLRDGKAVALTPKAFDLLLALVENRGRLMTKDRLMTLVWPGTFIEENNLAVHVSALRKILGETDNGNRYIKTVPKRGYSFVAEVREVLAAERATSQPRSLAVLPFKVMSSEAGDDYLGPGMTDAIITRLNQISQVVVRPTSAVLKYLKREIDPVDAGRELDVEAVLSGRITRSGDQIRMTVQLADVQSNRLLWADKLDHNFTDMFTYEDLISEHVAHALNLKLTAPQMERLTKRHTENSAAYLAYLKGRYYWGKRTPEGFRQAMQYFQHASDKDPSYGLACSGLADCYSLLNYYSVMPPKVGMEKAKTAALKALEADESLCEAHASLALVEFWYEWDWLRAQIEFERAIQLNPSYATAHQWYSWYLVALGKQEQSIAEGKLALELDPLLPAINMGLGKSYFFSRLYDQSIKQCQRTLELDPNFIPAHYFLGQACEQKGRYDEAIAAYHKVMDLTPGIQLNKAIIARASALAGKKDEAEAALHSLLNAKSDEGYVPAYGIALVYLALGDKTRAIEYLEKAFAEKFIWLVYLNVDPVFDELRHEFAFKRLLNRLGFPAKPRSGASELRVSS